jgi:hypothetical protein
MDERSCVIEAILDDSGHAVDYRFLEVNHAFKSQTGLADAIGKTVKELVPDLEERWYELMAGRPLRANQSASLKNLPQWNDGLTCTLHALAHRNTER